MKRDDGVLADTDFEVIADVLDRSVTCLRAEIEETPRRLDELLASTDVATAIVDGDVDPLRISPRLLFAVFVLRSADELAHSDWVADWVGPGSRLPVFDVEPLVEFADAPARLHFLARLLVTFTAPAIGPLAGTSLDLDELVDWLGAVDRDERIRLLRQLGDLSLFQAGVFPDRSGAEPLTTTRAEHLGRSIEMSDDELVKLVDPTSPTAAIDALESLSASWYTAAAEESSSTPVLVRDIAHRIRSARRFLNYIADRYLLPPESDGLLTA